MTARRFPSPLGLRLAAAFVAVAVAAVAVLAALTIVEARREVSSLVRRTHARDASSTAAAVATAYNAAGSWADANLAGAEAIAASNQATLVVTDADHNVVASPTAEIGSMMAQMHGAADVNVARGSPVTAPVVVDGNRVGQVSLRYPISHLPGSEKQVQDAMSRTAFLGGLLAIAAALAVSLFVATRVARPLAALTEAAAAMEAGRRDARVDVTDAPGELGTLGRAFNRMADAVEREDALRRQLVADVSHEVRTPLTILRGTTEALVDGVAEPDPATLASLHEEVLRLTDLVSDLETLAAADAAGLRLEHEPVDLADIARGAAHALRLTAEEAGERLDVHLEPAPTTGDARRLRQIVTNLLANAVHYTGGGTIVIETGTNGSTAFCAVADSGPGIADDELPHLFERFWRGHAARGTQGSGIGLAVASELAAAHGGSITASNNTAHAGATFTLRLPS